MTIKIQIVSDIHLEFYTKLPGHICTPEFIKAPYLFLAGDIGIPLLDARANMKKYSAFLEHHPNPIMLWNQFIDWCSSNYKKIFYVIGNHESYGFTPFVTHLTIKQYFDTKPNCILLEEGIITPLDNNSKWQIIGTSLWSPQDFNISLIMNDVCYISGITYHDILSWNVKARQWLESTHITKNTIIMTHHLPSKALIPEKYKNPADMKYVNGFANDGMDDIIAKAGLWIFGHTHDKLDTEIAGTRCIVNPIGYKGENKNTEIVKIIELSDS